MSTPEQAAIDVARTFLDAVASRNLEAAEALTADDFTMIVSGGHRFDNLRSFVAYSATRQKTVAKHTEHFEALAGPHGMTVYCFGTMSGTWLDDSRYEDVRYIDRFVIAHGRISDMKVWSDMADFRPPDPPGA